MTASRRDSPQLDQSSFELVVVCTGNRARSPIAAGFLRHLLADLPVRIRSLGILDTGGAPPLSKALAASAAAGLDLFQHRSRALYREALLDSDLVLGFERHHAAAAVIDAGARHERVFLLPELVDLIQETGVATGEDPFARARETIVRASALRSRSGAPVPEIRDPIGQSDDVFRETVELIRDLSTRLAVGLFGSHAIRPLTGVSGNVPRRRSRGAYGRRLRALPAPGASPRRRPD